MIYRIVNGQKRLFADISKIQQINGKIGEGTQREVVLFAGDILVNGATENKVGSVAVRLAELETGIEEAGKIDSVNGQSPDSTSKNLTLYGTHIKQSGTVSESVSAGIERLTDKSHLDANDVVLEWDDSNGLLTHLSLSYSNGELKLLGKSNPANGNNPHVISAIPLDMDSQISYASTHEWTGLAWSPVLPDSDAVAQQPSSKNIGPYLVLGFQTAEGTEYSFSDLTSLITPISAGNGISVTPVSGSNQVSIKVDPNSDVGISVGSSGLKLDSSVSATFTAAAFAELNLSNVKNGIYYVYDETDVV